MDWQETIQFFSHCMPRALGRLLAAQPEGSVREIRVRAGGSAVLGTAQGDVHAGGTITSLQVTQMAEALCEHALYARSEEQRQGYVALRGGHRMGLCGRVIMQGQSIRSLREISSLCIRIAGQWKGAANTVLPHLLDDAGMVHSTLIVGLPGTGKTTLLRDLCRSLSEKGKHVCIADERSEIAAMLDGTAQLDVGPNTDVLDGCSKEAGLRWLLRSMAPEVMATDELGSMLDMQAVSEAARSGVSVLATLHGRDLETALAKGAMYHLVQNHVFARYVLLKAGSVNEIEALCDDRLRPLAL